MSADSDKNLIGEFIDACVKDQAKAASMLVTHPELQHARWTLQETPLHFLAIENFAEGVRFLSNHGIDLNAPNEFGDTALMDVVTLGNENMVRLLLELGADANAVSRDRVNPLHTAVQKGNLEIVELLLRAGALTDYVGDLGETVHDALPMDQTLREKILALMKAKTES